MPYENYQVADESPIELQVKQRKGMSESPEERQLGVALRERSTAGGNPGVRPFGNIESRRSKCYYKLPESKLKGAIIIGCTHNIIAYFKNKAWCSRFVKL